jgi:hypothetical protein
MTSNTVPSILSTAAAQASASGLGDTSTNCEKGGSIDMEPALASVRVVLHFDKEVDALLQIRMKKFDWDFIDPGWGLELQNDKGKRAKYIIIVPAILATSEEKTDRPEYGEYISGLRKLLGIFICDELGPDKLKYISKKLRGAVVSARQAARPPKFPVPESK